ncbi:MAG: CHAD domain-containing protein, partial [Actinomycetes bacterium]
RLRAAVGSLPAELVMGPVVQRIDRELAARRRPARGDLIAALDDSRHVALLDTLASLIEDPPLTAFAHQPAEGELPRLTARSVRRLRRSASAASAADEAAARDMLLHTVRKDAKRARYAAEVTVPVIGRKADQAARRLKRLQMVLGEHQDSVVARSVLRELGVAAHLAGENGFSFGLLQGLEEARGDDARSGYEKVLAKALRTHPRRWSR